MSTDERMNAVLRTWREGVRGKERRVFRLEERIGLRMDAIENRMRLIRVPLDNWEIRQFRYFKPGVTEPIDQEWRPMRIGDPWGGEKDISAIFRKTFTMPDELDGKPVILRLFVGGDSLVKVNGVPHHGLDIFRNELRLTPRAEGGKTCTIEVESFVYWHGHGGEPNAHTLEVSELVYVDPEIHAAYWDFRAAVKMFDINDMTPSFRSFLEKHVWEPLKSVPVEAPDSEAFKQGLVAASRQLRESFFASPRFHKEGLIHMVGHSHLDVVFLWTHGEYIRKVGRTHATMLRLLEQYPQFKFSQSQAKIYADMKEHYPALFEQVKARVREGRWEPLGAFWVEPDCNLISGESFVRQILEGQRFWEREFGMRSRICWQPDVFGVSGALPQILKRSGIDYFMTNKMFVWNDTNPWRKNNFWWEGPDGSRLLCVVPPGHFIGTVDPDQMNDQWETVSDKDSVGESLYCFGWGDGGGGVDPEMLECGIRYGDVPGLPQTIFTTALEAFESIEAKAKAANLPVVKDELYLEAHRGTYTSRGRLKKINRRGEFMLRETELLCSAAWLTGTDYPHETLIGIWREFLTNQFHDALPGTHIPPVYADLLESYEAIFSQLDAVRAEAVERLFPAPAREPREVMVFNTLLHERHGLISVPAELLGGKTCADKTGTPLTRQAVSDLDGTARVLVDAPALPPVGGRRFNLVEAVPGTDRGLRVTDTTLENEFLRAVFNGNGEVTSLWDKEADREVLADGQTGNVFQMYKDQPGKYDAWDIVAAYMDYELPIPADGCLTIDETGPLRVALRLERPLRESKLVQRISLEAGSRELRFETKVQWVERQTLLKVGFPVAVNSLQATYDMAYGNLTRPTHSNTSYDEARFEVPGFKWMDISEADYGVTLMNDCKYGHEARGHLMRLTLLKGPVYPDPESDMEDHFFTYAIRPHQGSWRTAGIVQEALNLNAPCMVLPTETAGPQAFSWMAADTDHVTLEAVKRSEDGKHLIVRLAEQFNSRGPVVLTFDRPPTAAWSCNIMEESEAELSIHGNSVTVPVKPFEVVTLRIAMQEAKPCN